MKKLLVAAAILATAASAYAADKAAPATAPKQEAQQPIGSIVARMQAFYEKTRGFDTRFEQSFRQGGMPSRFAGSTAQGRMRFRKPDGASGPLMRWDYADGRVLLLVGDKSWSYDPDTKQATEYRVDASNLSAAVTFLWGKGRIAEEFEIARATRTDLDGNGVALELTPKKQGQGFSQVFLVVDPATGAVRQSVVVQANGSENRISFVEPKLDASVEAGEFDPAKVFPAGTTLTRAAIPGQQ
ncbi:outer membrane lipoprotein carrier protein LolA [Vulgatibacter sp.]|uniref:outer membrane lipoprotein carrier protein LolA n=1 Tax=Vulgatibacter sp. TaxID=1971226 RepID=UPI0035657460